MSNFDSFAYSDLVAGFILNDCVQTQHQQTPGAEGQEGQEGLLVCFT